MSRAAQRPEIRCPEGLSGGPLPPEVWTDCSFITLAFSDTALTDPRNRAEGAGGPDVGQTIEDLLLQKAAWEAKGREAVLVRIDESCIRQPVEPGRDSALGPDTPPVEPAAVLVLKPLATTSAHYSPLITQQAVCLAGCVHCRPAYTVLVLCTLALSHTHTPIQPGLGWQCSVI